MDICPHITFYHVQFYHCVCLRCWNFYFSMKIKKQIHSLPWTSSVPCFNYINIICMSWVSDLYWWRPNRLPMSCSICNHLKFQTFSGSEKEQWKLVTELSLVLFLSLHFFSTFPFYPHQFSPFPFCMSHEPLTETQILP